MAEQKTKVKVLLAQFPLETHNRGIITVAGMLRDSGMEVILMGNALPEHIVTTPYFCWVEYSHPGIPPNWKRWVTAGRSRLRRPRKR